MRPPFPQTQCCQGRNATQVKQVGPFFSQPREHSGSDQHCDEGDRGHKESATCFEVCDVEVGPLATYSWYELGLFFRSPRDRFVLVFVVFCCRARGDGGRGLDSACSRQCGWGGDGKRRDVCSSLKISDVCYVCTGNVAKPRTSAMSAMKTAKSLGRLLCLL